MGAEPQESEKEAENVEVDSSSESSSSVSAEGSDEECEERFVEQQSNEAVLHVSPAVQGPLVQNKRSRILHRVHSTKNDLAMCGAKVTQDS